MQRAALILLSIVMFCGFILTSAQAQRRVPQFRDYLVNEVYIGANAPVVLTRSDRMFRTRLQNAAR